MAQSTSPAEGGPGSRTARGGCPSRDTQPGIANCRPGPAHVPATDPGAEHREKRGRPDIVQHSGGARVFQSSKCLPGGWPFILGESGGCVSASAHYVHIWSSYSGSGWETKGGRERTGKYELMKYHPSSARNRDIFSDVTLGCLPRGRGHRENTHKVLTQKSSVKREKTGRKQTNKKTIYFYVALPSILTADTHARRAPGDQSGEGSKLTPHFT